MRESNTEEIKKTITINASPEVVFRVLINETELMQWFSNERTLLEPQVGGAWMLKNCRSYTGKIHTMRGKILEIIQDKNCPIPGMSMSIQISQRQSSHG